jgi:hypothetical protein
LKEDKFPDAILGIANDPQYQERLVSEFQAATHPSIDPQHDPELGCRVARNGDGGFTVFLNGSAFSDDSSRGVTAPLA